MPEFVNPDGSPVYPEEKKISKKKRAARWGCAGLLLASVAGCSVAFWTSDKSPTHEHRASTTATPVGEPSPTTTGSLSEWFLSISDRYAKFEMDLGVMADDPSTDQCGVLLQDVQELQKHPIPNLNANLAGYWNRGLAYYEIAFAECRDGDFTSAGLDMDKGTAEFSKANDLLESMYS